MNPSTFADSASRRFSLNIGEDEAAASLNMKSQPTAASSRAALSLISPLISFASTPSKFSFLPRKKLSNAIASWPLSTRDLTIFDPTKPAPPVTKIFITKHHTSHVFLYRLYPQQ